MRARIETTVGVTGDELERLRECLDDVTVEGLREMTPQEKADYYDSMPDDAKGILRRFGEAIDRRLEKAAFDFMRQKLVTGSFDLDEAGITVTHPDEEFYVLRDGKYVPISEKGSER